MVEIDEKKKKKGALQLDVDLDTGVKHRYDKIGGADVDLDTPVKHRYDRNADPEYDKGKAEDQKRKKELMRKYGLLGGRPVAFKSPKELIAKIEEYLSIRDERAVKSYTKDGEEFDLIRPAPVHIHGFCAFAGITNQTLNDYQTKKGFAEPITRFKKICEAYCVDQLFEGQKGNKADFVLKNCYDWEDKSQTEFVGSGLKKVLVEFVGDAENGGDERSSGEDTGDICTAFEGKVED